VRYLLDTDIVSDPLKKSPSLVLLRRLAAIPAEQQFTSAITVGEMAYGAFRSPRAGELLARLELDVWPNYQIVEFDHRAAMRYGSLRADLEAPGLRLPEPDLRIAATALAHGMVLVTGNIRHSGRVPGLSLENWFRA